MVISQLTGMRSGVCTAVHMQKLARDRGVAYMLSRRSSGSPGLGCTFFTLPDAVVAGTTFEQRHETCATDFGSRASVILSLASKLPPTARSLPSVLMFTNRNDGRRSTSSTSHIRCPSVPTTSTRTRSRDIEGSRSVHAGRCSFTSCVPLELV